MAPSRTRTTLRWQRWWWTWTGLVLVAGNLEVPTPKARHFGRTQPQPAVQLPSVRRWMETGDRNDGGQLLDEGTLPWELRHRQGGTECSQLCETPGAAVVEITEGDATKGSGLGLLGARNESGICKGTRPTQGRTDQTHGRDPGPRGANPGSVCACATHGLASPAWRGAAPPPSVGRRHGDRRGAHGGPNEARAGKNPGPRAGASRTSTFDTSTATWHRSAESFTYCWWHDTDAWRITACSHSRCVSFPTRDEFSHGRRRAGCRTDESQVYAGGVRVYNSADVTGQQALREAPRIQVSYGAFWPHEVGRGPKYRRWARRARYRPYISCGHRPAYRRRQRRAQYCITWLWEHGVTLAGRQGPLKQAGLYPRISRLAGLLRAGASLGKPPPARFPFGQCFFGRASSCALGWALRSHCSSCSEVWTFQSSCIGFARTSVSSFQGPPPCPSLLYRLDTPTQEAGYQRIHTSSSTSACGVRVFLAPLRLLLVCAGDFDYRSLRGTSVAQGFPPALHCTRSNVVDLPCPMANKLSTSSLGELQVRLLHQLHASLGFLGHRRFVWTCPSSVGADFGWTLIGLSPRLHCSIPICCDFSPPWSLRFSPPFPIGFSQAFSMPSSVPCDLPDDDCHTNGWLVFASASRPSELPPFQATLFFKSSIHPWGPDLFAEGVPKSWIGGSGPTTPPPSSVLAFQDTVNCVRLVGCMPAACNTPPIGTRESLLYWSLCQCGAFVVPLARSLLLLLLLSLVRLWIKPWRAPSTPLGRVAASLGVACPGQPVLGWDPWRDRKGRPSRRRHSFRRLGPIPKFLSFYTGFFGFLNPSPPFPSAFWALGVLWSPVPRPWPGHLTRIIHCLSPTFCNLSL